MSQNASALLIIDMQNGLVHAAQAPFAIESVLENINQLIDAARAQQRPVIFVQHTGPEGTPLAQGSEMWQIAAELKRDENDIYLTKTRPSCFFQTSLLSLLHDKGIKRLAVAGMQTDYCVDTTCRGGRDLGIEMVLASDAHTTFSNGVLSAEQIIAHHNKLLSGPFVNVAKTAEIGF
ncbi:cysteine hydrolase [Erwiniaceae bacterium BAC15a-03b]|uniref:Cysteine hydrolase n=1 Tax=Winslowiella arboricola TaxID=2978220 RepID=A0A9J6PSI5_9GAMM|nr:cysteine hydrolase family protein [Winslowiella arboricola]MCU5773798.1 cysteine hydrolase [Winslowiella arboricola]MCU5777708.1 cysteine hydrolase [Winslowiella arboricola]